MNVYIWYIPASFVCKIYDPWMCILIQLGPKAEEIEKPVNPLVFLMRFILGAMAATYFILVPIYMWLKDQIVPKGMPIWKGGG